MLCSVALLSPPYGTLTYACPSYLPTELWQIGMRVVIPLGKGLRVGVVTKTDVPSVPNVTMKEIVWCMERKTLLSQSYMDMIHQLSLRQLTTIGRILGNVLPANMRMVKNIRIRQFLDQGKPNLLTMQQIASMSPEKQDELGKAFMENEGHQGSVHIQMLADDPASSERVVLLVDAPWNIRANAVKQRAILDYIEEKGSVSRRQLFKDLPLHSPAFNILVESSMIGIRTFEENQDDDPHQDFLPPAMPLFQLNEKQQTIFNELIPHIENFDDPQKTAQMSLLYGVTGSGKTAIYLDLAKHCMAQGKSVMILAPEVAIALKLRNDAQLRHLPVNIYHGYQNPRTRERIFQEHCVNLEPKLIIGTRSALFLPTMNLGLIILDEEHDDSFKQDEGLNYHAKDIAWYRVQKAKGLLLMGSATPDVKSFYATEIKAYKRFEMKERFGNATLPEIHLINIKDCKQSLAPESIIALKECLKQGNQAIIMLNRRGFAPIMYCLDCKKTARCPHCDISLAYHKKKEKLVCHYCGYNLPFPSPCSHCKSIHFLPIGEGTERLEEEISALVNTPTNPVNVLRLDKDSTRREGRMEEILNAFAKQEAQILIGTQMLSKGHHFPHVSLAIIADADLGLNFPDYRAAERTFQLLTQAAGRAGRGDKKGKVLIQTRDTTHYCWDFIKNNCYDEFYAHEIALREKRKYPPFIRLALIRGSFERNCKESPSLWNNFINRIKLASKDTSMKVLGPSPAPISFLQGRLRFITLIKGDNWQDIRSLYLQNLPQDSLCKKLNLKISLDIDPVNML